MRDIDLFDKIRALSLNQRAERDIIYPNTSMTVNKKLTVILIGLLLALEWSRLSLVIGDDNYGNSLSDSELIRRKRGDYYTDNIVNGSEIKIHIVIRVIDGDTLEVAGGERIRLIGVDTPETVHPKKPVEYFGKEASQFTKKMVEGKKVKLEYDWQRKDKYGRTLAYVYLEDGTFLNAEIIKQGYGYVYTRFPFKYMDEFRKYEKDARENNIGLWK
ncbi:MAG: thermonuclease family protein [Nitrospirota bacterium]